MGPSGVDVLRQPDAVRARVVAPGGEERLVDLVGDASGVWSGDGVVVGVDVAAATGPHDPAAGTAVLLRAAPGVGVVRVELRWRGAFGAGARYLGDHWERSYGDLEWRAEVPQRALPWYVLVTDPDRADGTYDGTTRGYGVAVGAAAMCCWTADRSGLTLLVDVRCGGAPVLLGDRPLAACRVRAVTGEPGERPFAVARRLCAVLSPAPRLPAGPVIGGNDWYLAYGRTSRDLVLRHTGRLVELAPAGARPFSVVDDGWSQGGLGLGPWYGNERFGDMAALAARVRSAGARPGLWYRPLTASPGSRRSWRLREGPILDPSVDEVLGEVAEQVGRFGEWGYELLKHDFTTFDVLGRWGFAFGADLTDGGWAFADRGRTTAEVLTALYRTIREAAGDGVLVMGCNTVGHLAAGLVELQRVGDDVSSTSWERLRRMGVNALAFRAPQHGTFFAADADIACISPQLPWEGARRWLDLVARSGTPLFVSLDPASEGPQQLAAVRDAFAAAVAAPALAEPLDWLDTVCPARWRLGGQDGEIVDLDWTGVAPASPFGV